MRDWLDRLNITAMLMFLMAGQLNLLKSPPGFLDNLIKSSENSY